MHPKIRHFLDVYHTQHYEIHTLITYTNKKIAMFYHIAIFINTNSANPLQFNYPRKLFLLK